jgi:hypothetical protein
MELRGTYKLGYTIDKEPKNLILNVELKMIDGVMKLKQNVWEGVAFLDGQIFTKEDLSHCVDARLAAERIGHKLRDELKLTAKQEGKSFRVKNEELNDRK